MDLEQGRETHTVEHHTAQHSLCGKNNGNPDPGVFKIKLIFHVFMNLSWLYKSNVGRTFQSLRSFYYQHIEKMKHFSPFEVNAGITVGFIKPG